MAEGYRGLVVVIPTRNRARLAMNAVRSVISQPDCDARILISDNSTEAQESDSLAQFCAEFGQDRVRYAKPFEPLSMTENFNWAIEQALKVYDANHFTLLTDRMLYRRNRLSEIIRPVSLFPDKIVSYMHDRVVDYSSPIYLEQNLWSGELLYVSAERLLSLAAQLIFHPALPRMMNCVVPRAIFERLRSRYGKIFDSIAPDFNFCYRCLDICESIIYYDKSILIHYALDRSNGESQARGVATKDHLDFIANLGQRRFNFASPIPEIMTVGNAIVHEYCYAKSETGSRKFPDVEMEKYLPAMAREVEELENPQLKEEMRTVLQQHGWARKEESRTARGPLSILPKLMSPRRVYGKLSQMMSSNAARPFWSLVLPLGIQPPGDHRFAFKTTEEALDYAEKYPRRKSQTAEHLDFLEPVPVDVGQEVIDTKARTAQPESSRA